MSLSSMDGHSLYYTDKKYGFFRGAILCFFSPYYTDRKTAFGGVRFFLHRMTLSSIEGHSLYYTDKNTAFVRGQSSAFLSLNIRTKNAVLRSPSMKNFSSE